jgi:hypothetical protein
MSSLQDRLVIDGGDPCLRSDPKTKVAELLLRLQQGEAVASLGCSAVDFVAVMGFSALEGQGSLGPSLVQKTPKYPSLASHLNETSLKNLLPGSDHGTRLALSAALLQIHDFWTLSHEAAQEADDQGERHFSAYWHGIAHRREPDAGNAGYWFRRVGNHEIFTLLADQSEPLLDVHGDSGLTARLLGKGGWNPMAMIDLCTQARPGTPQETIARRLQRLEMQLLLDATATSVLSER